jgi:hypothetical protein
MQGTVAIRRTPAEDEHLRIFWPPRRLVLAFPDVVNDMTSLVRARKEIYECDKDSKQEKK